VRVAVVVVVAPCVWRAVWLARTAVCAAHPSSWRVARPFCTSHTALAASPLCAACRVRRNDPPPPTTHTHTTARTGKRSRSTATGPRTRSCTSPESWSAAATSCWRCRPAASCASCCRTRRQVRWRRQGQQQQHQRQRQRQRQRPQQRPLASCRRQSVRGWRPCWPRTQ
jgi:hypothetical protein